MSNPNPATATTPFPRWLLWGGLLVLGAYAFLLARNFSPVAAGADSSGYLNSARLLASGHLGMELRSPPEFGPQEKLFRQQFQPHGFAPFEGRERLSPTYAVGLPLHLAAASLVLGWHTGPIAVGVGAALAGVLLCYAVARQLGVERPLAAAGAAALAAYPVYIYMSLQPLSDVLSAAWCLAAVAAALRSRERRAWALACGAAFGVGVLVRSTNALLLPALLVLLGADPRRLLLAVAGGIPFALWQGYYNHALYGSPFQSGYVNILAAFGWRYGAPTAWHFLLWLALMLPAVLLPFAVATVARSGEPVAVRWALGLWFGAFFVVYAFYEISHEVWWCLRFILPGTPALILAGLLGVQRIWRTPALRVVSAAVILAWAVALGWFWPKKHHLYLTRQFEQDYADAAVKAREHFPTGALVLAGHHSGSLYFYTGFSVLRWELVNPEEFARYRSLAQGAGRAICAVLYDSEEKEALKERCRGAWTKLATVHNVSLWRLEPDASAPSRP